MSQTPHYLLFSEASCSSSSPSWRFVLQHVETSRRMVVSDGEPTTCGERLELLAVVRGLEALDGPSRVTLVTRSRYVSRGIRFGMAEWRANDWQWERFGRIVPVKDCDLWQRIDRALLFHQVECQAWQFEEADEPAWHVSGRVMPTTAWCPNTAKNSRYRLAPTRRRLVEQITLPGRSRRRQPATSRSSGRLHNLSAAMVAGATALKESVRSLGQPVRRLVPGAA